MKRNLSLKENILVASTLFGMFFGAGNLIFPVHLGQMAGNNVLPATIGFIITAVSIPILGVAAIGSTHSDNLYELSCKVSPWYGYAFTCLLYLTIGPFFAIPRCATVSFVTGVEPLVAAENVKTAQFVFSLVFFAIVLIFSLRPGKIMTWIGKVINPVFLVFLSVLVFAALTDPGAKVSEIAPAQNYEQGAFFNGFIEGYGTMDAIAGLAFGIVVISMIRRLGIEDDSAIAKNTVISGFFTAILMALIYVLTIVMGAQSRGLFELSENGGIALVQISNHYLGTAGGIILALTITFACLKTAIGLVTSCSEIFVIMFQGPVKYKAWAVIFSVFSFIVSNIGLTAIINYSIPVLMLLYPLAIVMIAMALFEKRFGGSRCVYACVSAGAFLAAMFDFIKTLPAEVIDALHLGGADVFARAVFPFYDLGFGWLIPSLIGLAVGLLLSKRTKRV